MWSWRVVFDCSQENAESGYGRGMEPKLVSDALKNLVIEVTLPRPRPVSFCKEMDCRWDWLTPASLRTSTSLQCVRCICTCWRRWTDGLKKNSCSLLAIWTTLLISTHADNTTTRKPNTTRRGKQEVMAILKQPPQFNFNVQSIGRWTQSLKKDGLVAGRGAQILGPHAVPDQRLGVIIGGLLSQGDVYVWCKAYLPRNLSYLEFVNESNTCK